MHDNDHITCLMLCVEHPCMWSLINHFVEYSPCYKLVKTKSQYYFSIQSYGILKTAKTSNLKAHNDEKMAVKEKEPTSFKLLRTFKMAKNT